MAQRIPFSLNFVYCGMVGLWVAADLGEGEVGFLTEDDLVVSSWVRVVSVLVEPLLQRRGPLRSELVPR
jgi:hypothetical protein